ncbi:MAG: DNA-binding protein [Duganella sp.]
MARICLSKSDVKQARDAVVAQSRHPSVDAVRAALGDTGSKSTIHKYLKELEQEEGGGTRPAHVSDALQDLVARLAARLQDEAEEALVQARAELDAREQQYIQANRQLEHDLRAAREVEGRLQTELRQQRLAFNIKQDELSQLNKESSRLATELAHTKQSLFEQLTHARKLEQKVEHLQAQHQHSGDLERQLATSIARNEQLSDQYKAADAARAPAEARARELELLLAQANAKAQAQDQIGEQLRGYLDKMAGGPSATALAIKPG